MASGFFLCKVSRPLTARPSTTFLCNPIIKRTSSTENGVEERAPSTADEFRRVAEEKLGKAEEEVEEQVTNGGVASQSSVKAGDAAEEAVTGCGDTEAVKDKYKQDESGT